MQCPERTVIFPNRQNARTRGHWPLLRGRQEAFSVVKSLCFWGCPGHLRTASDPCQLLFTRLSPLTRASRYEPTEAGGSRAAAKGDSCLTFEGWSCSSPSCGLSGMRQGIDLLMLLDMVGFWPQLCSYNDDSTPFHEDLLCRLNDRKSFYKRNPETYSYLSRLYSEVIPIRRILLTPDE